MKTLTITLTAITLAFLASACSTTLAVADTVGVMWDPATGATSYDVQRSTDFNATTGAGTWTTIGTVAATACTPTGCSYTDTTAPAGAYYRMNPKNAAGTLLLNKKGVWYCGACPSPPGQPASIGLTY